MPECSKYAMCLNSELDNWKLACGQAKYHQFTIKSFTALKIPIGVVISQVVKMGSMKNFHSLLDTLPLLANPIEESVPGESDFQNRFLT